MLISFSKPSFDSLYLHTFSIFFPLHSIPLISPSSWCRHSYSCTFLPSWFLLLFSSLGFSLQLLCMLNLEQFCKTLNIYPFSRAAKGQGSPQELQLYPYQHLDLPGSIWKAEKVNLPGRTIQERFSNRRENEGQQSAHIIFRPCFSSKDFLPEGKNKEAVEVNLSETSVPDIAADSPCMRETQQTELQRGPASIWPRGENRKRSHTAAGCLGAYGTLWATSGTIPEEQSQGRVTALGSFSFNPKQLA